MDSLILSQAIKFVPEYRTIIMKRLLFIFTFFCLPAIHGGAQNILTLENCLLCSEDMPDFRTGTDCTVSRGRTEAPE